MSIKTIIIFLSPFFLLAQNVHYPDTLYTNTNIIYPCIITKLNQDNIQIKNNYGISSTTPWTALSKVILYPIGTIYTADLGFQYDLDSISVCLANRLVQGPEISDTTNTDIITGNTTTEMKQSKKNPMQISINAGTLFSLQTNFSGSGPHEPADIELSTDDVWADKGFAGFAVMGRVFNIGNSFVGAELGLNYSKFEFSGQDVVLSHFPYSGTIYQPSFEVKSYNIQAALLASPKCTWVPIFETLRPYIGIGFTYAIATVSDINLEPEYGVGGHSDAQGYGYILKSGIEYIVKKEYIVALETYYHSSDIKVDKFRSFNIDGIDGNLNILACMIYIGKIF